MHPTLQKILALRPVITDGAWGTQLQAKGLPQGACPDQLNLTKPEWVEMVARSYIDAGSDIILTNTFGANSIILEKYELREKTFEINRAGASISKTAAAGNALVFGSIGPSGKMLLMGETTEDELQDAFTQQAAGLADGGADAIIVETMSDLEEAKIALSAAKTTGLPVLVSMVFDSGKDKDRTLMGTTIEDAASFLEEAGADGIGANCGSGIESYIPVAKRLRTATDLPVWIKPNAGLPEIIDGNIVYTITPAAFASHAKTIIDTGVDFIGGCCGTAPAFIESLVHLKQSSI